MANKRTKLAAIVLGAVAALLFSIPVQSTDIPINPLGPGISINGLIWGNSGANGFNNNFFFTPLYIGGNVCVFVKNNNPTNVHRFQISILITSDPQNITPSDGTWQAVASTGTIVASLVGTSPSIASGLGASISGATQVAVSFAGSVTQAGNPDTANVRIVQTTSACPTGNSLVGAAINTVAVVPAIQASTDGLSQSYQLSTSVTNPAINTAISVVNDGNSAKSIYFDKLLISTSATANIVINEISDQGSGCALNNNNVLNMKLSAVASGTSVAAASGQACVTPPTVVIAAFGPFTIAANTPTYVDLKGYIAPSGTNTGIDVQMSTALTGVISTAVYWYEK